MAMKPSEIDDGPVCRREFLQQCAAGAVVLGLTLGLPGRLRARPMTLRWLEGSRSERRGGEITYPLPTEDGVSVDRNNEIILARADGAIYAFALSCPHQRAMLKWREKDHQFRCTKHGSRYDPTGEYVSGRATRGMDRYAVRIEGNEVVVDTDRKYLQDEDLADWEGATARVE